MAEISFTSARHHTTKLVQAGDVELFSYKGRTRLFPRGFPHSERILVSEVRGKTATAVLKGMLEDRLESNVEIAKSTGLAKSTVSKYIHIFLRLGIVRETSSPQGKVRYSPEGPVVNLLKFGSAGLRSAVDNYLDLWDF